MIQFEQTYFLIAVVKTRFSYTILLRFCDKNLQKKRFWKGGVTAPSVTPVYATVRDRTPMRSVSMITSCLCNASVPNKLM